MKKTIKKIIALGMGTALLGASVFGATLNQYPAPFIENGKFQGTLVVGDGASAQDVVGVSDIATSLQYASTIKVGTGTKAQTFVEGDFFEFVKGTDKLDYNEVLTSVVSTLDKDDLDALYDGTLRGKSVQDFSQSVDVAEASVVYDVYDEISDDPDLYLKFPAGQPAIKYSLTFDSGVISDIDDDVLEDFEDKRISILGTEYTITKAEYLGGADDNIRLTLMGGAVQDTLEVGQKKTYELNDESYEVEVMVIAGDNKYDAIVKLIVNEHVTPSLSSGDVYTMEGGVDLGIKEVIPTKSGDLVQNLVEFYIGAERIVMDHNGLDIGAESNLADIEVDITTTVSDDELRLSDIEITWTPGSDLYVPLNGTLLDAAKAEDEEDYITFLNRFGLGYHFVGPADVDFETVQFEADGDEALTMDFVNKNDEEYTVPMFFYDAGVIKFGEKADRELHVDEGDVVKDNEYFLVENDEITRVLRLIQVKDEYIKIRDVGTGDTNEYSIDSTDISKIKLDGYNYKVSVNGSDIMLVDITDDGDGRADIWTKFGSKFELSENVNDTNIAFYEALDSEGSSAAIFGLNVSYGDELDYDGFTGIDLSNWESNDDKYSGYSTWGTMFERDAGGDQDEWKLDIPESQLEMDVLFTSGAIVTETIGGEDGDVVVQDRIEVGSTKLASEIVGDETSQNLILVGGPCANPAVIAASSEFPRCDDWTLSPGEAMLQLVEQADGNVALLVAGTTAADTRMATEIVARMIKLGELEDTAMKKMITSDGDLVDFPEVEVVDEPDTNESDNRRLNELEK